MKKLITLLTLVFAVSNVNATSLHPDTDMTTANLNTISIAEDSPLADYDLSFASVEIRPMLNTITLLLHFDNSCPRGQFCRAFFAAPIEYVVNIDTTTTDGCGFKYYVGTMQDADDESVLTHIKIADSSELVCRILAPALSVELTRVYVTEEGVETYVHQFSGNDFLTSPF